MMKIMKGKILIIFIILLGVANLLNSEDKSPKSGGKNLEEKDVITLDYGEKVYLKEKKIEISGVISNAHMPLELLACAEGGKDYESLVVLKCKPQNIHMALILFGLKEGKGPQYFGDPTKPTGDLVLVFIEWQQDGKTFSYRAEDLIIDLRYNQSMPRTGWSFTGSRFEDEIDFDTGKPTGRKIYLANATKTIIATYHDPAAILDNPSESGGVGNIFVPNKKLLPEVATEVKVIIRAPNEEELKELKKINEEAEKKEKEWQEKIKKEQKKE